MDTAFFDQFAAEFSGDRFEAAAMRFNFPSAIYFDEQTVVFHNQKQLGKALSAYKERLRKFSYDETRAEVFAMSPPRGNRQLVWVSWHHYDAVGKEIEKSSIKYFCCAAPGDNQKIQLAEYLEAPSVCLQVNGDVDGSEATLMIQ